MVATQPEHLLKALFEVLQFRLVAVTDIQTRAERLDESDVALLTVSKEPAAAREMIRFMISPEAAPLLRKTHVEPFKS